MHLDNHVQYRTALTGSPIIQINLMTRCMSPGRRGAEADALINSSAYHINIRYPVICIVLSTFVLRRSVHFPEMETRAFSFADKRESKQQVPCPASSCSCSSFCFENDIQPALGCAFAPDWQGATHPTHTARQAFPLHPPAVGLGA